MTPDTAVEVYSVTRDRWKALRVQNSFTGAFTLSCVLSPDVRGEVTVFGGINSKDMTRPIMDSDLHKLRLQCEAGGKAIIPERVRLSGYLILQIPELCVMRRCLVAASTWPGTREWAELTQGEVITS